MRLTYPKRLAEAARQRASKVQGDAMDPAEGLEESWRERMRDRRAWSAAGDRFVMEWQMAGKEIAFGFLVAGAIAALATYATWHRGRITPTRDRATRASAWLPRSATTGSSSSG